jgi:DNA ligase-1
MKFSELAKYLSQLEKTSSRIEITKILVSAFKKAKTEEIDKITYLVLGKLAPSYENIVFNIAERMMVQILSSSYGQKIDKVRSLYKESGDLGDVAEGLARVKTQSSKFKKSLSVTQVYRKLFDIAEDAGEGSQERKINKMAELLSQLDPLSARFVARIPVGKLRLGFSDRTVIDALSWMVAGDKSRSGEIERAYFVRPDVGLLVRLIKKVGIDRAVENVKPALGTPVLPMLAQRLKSPSEMIEKMGEVVVEPKFDGLRIQLHFKKGGFDDGPVKAFTRNLNETSWMFPELQKISRNIKAKEVVLDCEAIGVDEQRKKLVNFQATMTRRRKHQIKEMRSKVGIKFYVFDLLYRNGKSLMGKSYLQRRRALDKTIKRSKLIEVVGYKVTKDPQVIVEMMRQELQEGLEGIIVKKANSKYVPGRTGWRWVKMKEEEAAHAKLADTLDCVVMGYSVGRGKRAQFGVGQFLVGVGDGEKMKTVSKVGTGITDEQLKELKVRLREIGVRKKPKEYKVHNDLEPDYWVESKLVVEIAADEITKSPKHTSGYALRFPRLIKIRDDRSVKNATTLEEIKKLFKLQG